MRTSKPSLMALVLLFWLVTVSAFSQPFSTWHQSLWWDGANVTANGIGRFTNVAGGTVVFFNPSGGPTAIDLQSQGNTDFVLLNNPGVGLQLGPLGNLATVSASGNLTASSFTGVGSSLTALNATQLTSGTVPTNVFPSPLFKVGAGLLAVTNGALVTATTNGQTPAGTITGVVPIANGGTGSSTGDGSGLTNLSMADGGKTLAAAGVTSSAWGSSNGMNPNSVRNIFYSSGSTAGYAAGTDAANIAIGESTNFSDSGNGWGSAVMGGGTGSGGANIISFVAGPTAVFMPTNRTSQLIPGGGYMVFSTDAVNDRFWGVCSPGYNDAASLDPGNYFGFLMDAEHGFFGAPLENATTAGCYQPDDVVYQFTVTNVTTIPTLVGSSVYSNNGHYYTAYSNNISGGNGSLMMTCAYGAPAASGTLIYVSGAGQSTIGFTASASLRSWNWGMKYRPSTGSLFMFSNINAGGTILLTNGLFQSQVINSDANGVNPFTSSRLTFGAANQTGLAIQDNGGVESASIGTRGHYVASGNSGSGTDLWYATPTFDIGGDELANFNNRGSCELMVNGSLGLRYTNTAANYNVTVQDGVVSLNASGTITATLPDASSHAKGRIFIIKNTGTTNSTIATTSAQTIDGKTSTTNAPNESLIGISDGANWKLIGSYGGAPTNFFAVTTSGFTNTTPWEEVAYVTNAAAVTMTNFLANGQAYLTNTTLLNGTMTIMLMPGDSFQAAAVAGLGGTVRALKR